MTIEEKIMVSNLRLEINALKTALEITQDRVANLEKQNDVALSNHNIFGCAGLGR